MGVVISFPYTAFLLLSVAPFPSVSSFPPWTISSQRVLSPRSSCLTFSLSISCVSLGHILVALPLRVRWLPHRPLSLPPHVVHCRSSLRPPAMVHYSSSRPSRSTTSSPTALTARCPSRRPACPTVVLSGRLVTGVVLDPLRHQRRQTSGHQPLGDTLKDLSLVTLANDTFSRSCCRDAKGVRTLA